MTDPEHRRSSWLRYLALVLMFAGLQLALAVLVRANHDFGNLAWYAGVGAAMHEHGFFNLWTPYPPLFPALLYVWTSFVHDPLHLRGQWIGFNVLLIAITACAVYGTRRGSRDAVIAAFGYALFSATFTSQVALGAFIDQFDYLPIALLLGSAWAFSAGRSALSAVLCALGALAKGFPALALLAAWLCLRETPARMRYGALFAVTCLLCLAPFALHGFEPLRSTYEFSASRGSWESVWHFPRIKFPPTPAPSSMLVPFRNPARPYAFLPWLTLLALVAYASAQRLRPSRATFADHLLCALLILLLFAKGISSYFVLWLVPLLFVCYRPEPAFALASILLMLVNASLLERNAYWYAIGARHVLFAGILIERLRATLRPAPVPGAAPATRA